MPFCMQKNFLDRERYMYPPHTVFWLPSHATESRLPIAVVVDVSVHLCQDNILFVPTPTRLVSLSSQEGNHRSSDHDKHMSEN